MNFIRRRIEQAASANRVIIDNFTYTATFLALGVGATTPLVVNISADSDFLWEQTTLTVMTTPGVFLPTPDLLVSFIDTGSSRNLQDFPIHVMNCTGNAQLPFILPEGKLLRGNGGLQVTVQNLSGVIQARVDFAFQGIKVFYTGGFNRDDLVSGF